MKSDSSRLLTADADRCDGVSTTPKPRSTRLKLIYDTHTAFLREQFARASREEAASAAGCARPIRKSASRPRPSPRSTSRLSYGHVAGPGVYSTTVTQPELFRSYLDRTDPAASCAITASPVEIGPSSEPIPLHFAFPDGDPRRGRGRRPHRPAAPRHLRRAGPRGHRRRASSTAPTTRRRATPLPLAPFTAPRVDYSLHRLPHYTATRPEHLPELRDLHQLPVLHRRVRRQQARATDGAGRGRLRQLRRARQSW